MRKTVILAILSGISLIALCVFDKINLGENSPLRQLDIYNKFHSFSNFTSEAIEVINTKFPFSLWHNEDHSFSNFTNETIEEINKKFPFSLWHNENIDYSKRDDRIDSQRKWMQFLSELHENVPVKNILVFVKQKAIYDVKPENEEELCPLEYKINDKCNFVRLNSEDKKLKLEVSKFSEYDAVISAVHGRNAINSMEKKYGTELWKLASEGRYTPPHVYFTLESPISPHVLKVNLFMNNKILASYWSNADISLPYGKWVANGHLKSNISESQKNYAKGKTKMVAMLISNCRDQNGRLHYAEKLNEYIQVDIYGRCSPKKLRCDNCFEMLKKEYKFYLAFENANCRDYITEKLFSNALQNDIVPIVMGAHPDDYKYLAPHHSYIHVEDFKSPKDLADYLIKLNNNDELYNEYFKWKGTGQFIDTRSDFFCRVCAMMIYSDFYPKPMWRINSTWENENHCLARNVWYWSQ